MPKLKLMEILHCDELVDLLSKYLDHFESLNTEISIKTGEKFEAKYDPETRAILTKEIESLEKKKYIITVSIARGLSILRRKGCNLQNII